MSWWILLSVYLNTENWRKNYWCLFSEFSDTVGKLLDAPHLSPEVSLTFRIFKKIQWVSFRSTKSRFEQSQSSKFCLSVDVSSSTFLISKPFFRWDITAWKWFSWGPRHHAYSTMPTNIYIYLKSYQLQSLQLAMVSYFLYTAIVPKENFLYVILVTCTCF